VQHISEKGEALVEGDPLPADGHELLLLLEEDVAELVEGSESLKKRLPAKEVYQRLEASTTSTLGVFRHAAFLSVLFTLIQENP
jgi:hypothetical protein